MTIPKTLLVTLCGVVLFVSGVLIGLGISPQVIAETRVSPIDTEARARILIDPELGNGFTTNAIIDAHETIGSLMQKIANNSDALAISTQSFGDMGTLITGINTYHNGDDNRYWQYWINGEYGLVDAFKQELVDGDIIFWKFTKSQFNEL